MVFRLLIGLVFMVAMAAAWFVFGDVITLTTIQDSHGVIASFIAQQPIIASLMFVMLYFVVVVFSLPFASLLTLSAGFFFSYFHGLFMVVCAACIGAMALFILVRSTVGVTLVQKAAPAYQRINAKISKNPASTLLFLRFVPIFPFFIVNLVAGLMKVRFFTAFWTCLVGILPGTAVYVALGVQLSDVETLSDLVQPSFLLVMTGLGLLMLLPKLITHIKDRQSESRGKGHESDI